MTAPFPSEYSAVVEGRLTAPLPVSAATEHSDASHVTTAMFVQAGASRLWSEMTFAERVKHLIDKHDKGSINRVAKRAGVPQRTLARIVEGADPRMSVILALSEYYRARADWMLEGVGEYPFGPIPPTPCPACGCTCKDAR